MAIVGFNFTKITVQKDKGAKGKIDIKNNVALSNVEEANVSIGNDSQKTAKISFDFDITYEPKIGEMQFKGDILYLGDAKRIKEIIDNWKKNKALPKDMATGMINTILNRCNVQALILSQQVNLPAPVPLPKIQPKKQ